MTKPLDIQPNQIYNNLKVLSQNKNIKSKSGRMWNLLCFCGVEFIVSAAEIKKRKSCGCIKTKIALENSQKSIKWKHSKIYKNLYNIWHGMKRRCLDKKSEKYQRYGERGIKIYTPWIDNFDLFVEYIIKNIGERPNKNYSLDRINNNGNYEPNNLKWSTRSEQIQNSSKSKLNINQVNEIKLSNLSNKFLAQKYNVKIRLINRILSGETWK